MSIKGKNYKNYSSEFKIFVIMDMREHKLIYNETVGKYNLGDLQFGGARRMLQRWERIF